MLRAVVVALLLANLLFFAWTQGWLDSLIGIRAHGDREPERLLRQIHPESVKVLPAGAASATPVAEAACFEAGPFAEAEWASAQSAAQSVLPSRGWTSVDLEQSGSWMLYMGPYPTRDAELKKEDELKRRKVAYEEVIAPPALAAGLSLGRFDAKEAAAAALEHSSQQGIHTARVVELVPASHRKLMRIERADQALASRIAALGPDAIAGKTFLPCKASTGT